MRKVWPWAVAAAVFIADRVTKILAPGIPDLLRFEHGPSAFQFQLLEERGDLRRFHVAVEGGELHAPERAALEEVRLAQDVELAALDRRAGPAAGLEPFDQAVSERATEDLRDGDRPVREDPSGDARGASEAD